MPAAPEGSGSPSVHDVARQLVDLIDRSPGNALRAVANSLDSVVTALRATADGSATNGNTDSGITAAVSAFAAARDAAAESAQTLHAAVDHLTAYLQALGFPTPTAPTNPSAVTAVPPTPRTALDAPPPPPPDPDAQARRLLAELPPHKPGDKTRGLWVDDHGERHHLISGEHDEWHKTANRHAVAIGLVDSGTKLAISSHVEVKFAMYMRANNVQNATITVNKTPCPGFLGCQRRLSQFLAAGSQLTVHGPSGYRRTYHGRGR